MLQHLIAAAQSKTDTALTAAAVTSAAWAPFLAAVDEWAPRVMFLLGFILLGLRIYRQWRHRSTPPRD